MLIKGVQVKDTSGNKKQSLQKPHMVLEWITFTDQKISENFCMILIECRCYQQNNSSFFKRLAMSFKDGHYEIAIIETKMY